MTNSPQLHALHANGTTLHYIDQGDGVPLVLVHGSLSDWRTWRSQIEPLAQRYRVIAYSRRYHAPNPWTGDGSDYSAALHARDLAALIAGLALGPVHLAASSYGGYIALLFTASYPEQVRSLVLGEPPILSWLVDIPGGAPLLAAFTSQVWEPARQAFDQGNPEQGVRLFLNAVQGADVFDQLPPPAQAGLMDNAPELKAETSAPGLFSVFQCEDAARIQVPALLLNGEHSPAMFHLITTELARCLPHAERAMIANASHAMHQGNPQAYNTTVLDFLARHEK